MTAQTDRTAARASARPSLADQTGLTHPPTTSRPDRDTAPSGEPTAPHAVGGEGNLGCTAVRHTQGPWAVAWNVPHLEGLTYVHGPGGVDNQAVAVVFTAATPEAEGNATLMAAAPDLLAELKAAHRIIRNALNLMAMEQKIAWAAINERAGVAGEGATRANEREATIAKAEGRA